MRSTPTLQTLHQQVTMALMWLWQHHFFPIYTAFNQMHFIWHWTHLSYTYVQLISEVQMLLQCCFAVQYPSQPCERKVVVNSTHLKSIYPWLGYVFQLFFKLSEANESSENRLCHQKTKGLSLKSLTMFISSCCKNY